MPRTADDTLTVRELLTALDGKGLVCNSPDQVNADLLLLFGIGLDTPLQPIIAISLIS
jgi:hypothetical protein